MCGIIPLQELQMYSMHVRTGWFNECPIFPEVRDNGLGNVTDEDVAHNSPQRCLYYVVQARVGHDCRLLRYGNALVCRIYIPTVCSTLKMKGYRITALKERTDLKNFWLRMLQRYPSNNALA